MRRVISKGMLAKDAGEMMGRRRPLGGVEVFSIRWHRCKLAEETGDDGFDIRRRIPVLVPRNLKNQLINLWGSRIDRRVQTIPGVCQIQQQLGVSYSWGLKSVLCRKLKMYLPQFSELVSSVVFLHAWSRVGLGWRLQHPSSRQHTSYHTPRPSFGNESLLPEKRETDNEPPGRWQEILRYRPPPQKNRISKPTTGSIQQPLLPHTPFPES